MANYLTNPDGIIGNEDDVWNLDGLDTEAADAIEALATTYWEYTMDHVIAALKLENLEEYVQMETKASALPRDLTTKSMSDRQDALKAIAAFLAECGE